MKVIDILDKELIIPELESRTKRDVLSELASVLVNRYTNLDLDSITEVLLEREKLGSTGIGDGIAIPHGKLSGLKHLMISFGRSLPGVDFDSMDEKPAHLFFLLVAPENSVGVHLKALARISRLLRDPQFRKRLMEAKDREQIYQVISEEDAKY